MPTTVVPRAMARAFLSCVLAVGLWAAGGAGSAANAGQGSAGYKVVASLAHEDGANFYSPLTQGGDGLMYGVAQTGGVGGTGTVFRVEADGTLTVVHAFTASDGNYLLAPLTLGIDGWLYGTAAFGGPENQGVIYKVSIAGDFVVLHAFSKKADQGLQSPQTQLVSDGQGGFYGTGHLRAHWIKGVIFHCSAAGEITLLAQFTGPHHGRDPNSLVMGRDGILYGATSRGSGGHGGNIAGTFFSYTPGKGLKLLHTFDASKEGDEPASTLAVGPDGAIYGVLTRGGTSLAGSIYRITPKGVFSLLHTFSGNDPIGSYADGGLAIDASGKLYGTTGGNGEFGGGTVFSITRKGETHVIQALGESKSAKGYAPYAGPTSLPDGTLWGVNSSGGANDWGTIFRIDPEQ